MTLDGKEIAKNTVKHIVKSATCVGRGDGRGQFFGPSDSPLIFRPLGIDTARESSNGNLNYTAVIRTKPGIAGRAAADELTALIEPFQRENKTELYITLTPLQQQVTRNARSALWLLLATVGAAGNPGAPPPDPPKLLDIAIAVSFRSSTNDPLLRH